MKKINKKGFTLIELLAVILILGIVVTLSIVFVPDMIEKSRQKSYEATKKNILSSAETYVKEFYKNSDWVTDPSISNDAQLVDNSNSIFTCVSLMQLIDQGYFKNKDDYMDALRSEEKYKNASKEDIFIKLTKKGTVVTNAEFSNLDEDVCNITVLSTPKASAKTYTSVVELTFINVSGSVTKESIVEEDNQNEENSENLQTPENEENTPIENTREITYRELDNLIFTLDGKNKEMTKGEENDSIIPFEHIPTSPDDVKIECDYNSTDSVITCMIGNYDKSVYGLEANKEYSSNLKISYKYYDQNGAENETKSIISSLEFKTKQLKKPTFMTTPEDTKNYIDYDGKVDINYVQTDIYNGLATKEYSVDNGTNYLAYSDALTITEENNNKKIIAKISDGENYLSNELTPNFKIMRDCSCTLSPANGTNTSKVTVSINVPDKLKNLVKNYSWDDSSKITTATRDITKSGSYSAHVTLNVLTNENKNKTCACSNSSEISIGNVPRLTISGAPDGWTSNNVTLTFKTNRSDADIYYCEASSTNATAPSNCTPSTKLTLSSNSATKSYTTTTAINKKICAYAKNTYGTSSTVCKNIKIDKVKPNYVLNIYKKKNGTILDSSDSISGLDKYSSGNWTNANLFLKTSLSKGTGGISDVSGKCTYASHSGTGKDYNNFSSYINMDLTSGTYDTYKITCVAENAAGIKSDSKVYTIKIDKVKPTINSVVMKKTTTKSGLDFNSSLSGLSNYDNNSWYNKYVFTKATTSDGGGSGVKSVTYTTTGATTNVTDVIGDCGNSNNIGCRYINAEGKSYITYKVEDNAGNVTTGTEYTIKLDHTAPTISSVIMKKTTTKSGLDFNSSLSGLSNYDNNSWYNKYVFTKAKTSDSGGSGVKSVTYTTKGATTNETNATGKYRYVNAEGISYITYKVTDNAGNVTTGTEYTIKLDRTPPTGYIIDKNGTLDSKSSGIVKIECDSGGDSSKNCINTNGNYVFKAIKSENGAMIYNDSCTDATSGIDKRYIMWNLDKTNNSNLIKSSFNTHGSYVLQTDNIINNLTFNGADRCSCITYKRYCVDKAGNVSPGMRIYLFSGSSASDCSTQYANPSNYCVRGDTEYNG